MGDNTHEVPEIGDPDLARITNMLTGVGGPNVVWGAGNVLEVWLVEQRLRAEKLATRRLLIATWVLAVATIGLVFATVGLIVVA